MKGLNSTLSDTFGCHVQYRRFITQLSAKCGILVFGFRRLRVITCLEGPIKTIRLCMYVCMYVLLHDHSPTGLFRARFSSTGSAECI